MLIYLFCDFMLQVIFVLEIKLKILYASVSYPTKSFMVFSTINAMYPCKQIGGGGVVGRSCIKEKSLPPIKKGLTIW